MWSQAQISVISLYTIQQVSNYIFPLLWFIVNVVSMGTVLCVSVSLFYDVCDVFVNLKHVWLSIYGR